MDYAARIYRPVWLGRILYAPVALLPPLFPVVWAIRILPALMRPSDAGWVAELERTVPEVAGVRQVFVFDFPGKIAYYSTMNVLATDGLTADLRFQHDLSGRLPSGA